MTHLIFRWNPNRAKHWGNLLVMTHSALWWKSWEFPNCKLKTWSTNGFYQKGNINFMSREPCSRTIMSSNSAFHEVTNWMSTSTMLTCSCNQAVKACDIVLWDKHHDTLIIINTPPSNSIAPFIIRDLRRYHDVWSGVLSAQSMKRVNLVELGNDRHEEHGSPAELQEPRQPSACCGSAGCIATRFCI